MKTYEVDIGGKTYEVDAPDPDTAYRYAQAHVAAQGERDATFKQRAGVERRRLLDEEVASMSPFDKAAANVGAGVNNLWTGAKQIASKVGIGDGVPDEEVRSMRERNEALARGTDLGIGPDWMPTTGKVLQFAGEVAPTMLIPAGGFVKGGAMLGKALGVAKGASTAAKLGSGAAALDAAIAGGLSGALTPTTSDESRLKNVAYGAAGGAALPLAVAGGRAARDAFAIGQTGKEIRAGKILQKALGSEERADQVAGLLRDKVAARAQEGPITRDIPLTAAEVTQDSTLASLERSAAARNRDDWTVFRANQNAARDRGLRETARRSGVDEIGALEGFRDRMTKGTRERALQSADDAAAAQARSGLANYGVPPTPAQVLTDPLRQVGQGVVGRSVPASPRRALGEQFMRTLDENPAAAHLYEERKLLADRLNGPAMPGDRMSAVVAGERAEAMRLIEAIDNRLDQLSNGTWRKYLSDYSEMSRPIDSAAAVRNIVTDVTKARRENRVFDPNTGREVTAPEVTRSALERATVKHGRNEFGDVLLPNAREDVQALLENLRKSDIQQTVKTAATSGGGSNTATDIAAGAATKAVSGGGWMADLLRAGKYAANIGEERGQGALSAALRSPEATQRLLVQAIERKVQAGIPLTAAEDLALRSIRTATAGAALGLAGQQ